MSSLGWLVPPNLERVTFSLALLDSDVAKQSFHSSSADLPVLTLQPETWIFMKWRSVLICASKGAQ